MSFQTRESRHLVPDEETAIKVAEALWLPIYGKRIYKELPFKADLKGDTVWIVHGTLHGNTSSRYDSTGNLVVGKGGVVTAEIRKQDCKIIRVYHGK